MENKECTTCNKIQTIDNFNKSKKGKFGVRSCCKTCSKIKYNIYRKNNLEKYAEHQRNFREFSVTYNELDRKRKREYKLTLKGFASTLYSSAKHRSKIKNIEFNISSDFVYNKLKLMKCDITNFNLQLDKTHDGRINPLLPSLDRINSNLGYIESNTRIVCWWWNVMKQDWSDDTIKNLIKQYINE